MDIDTDLPKVFCPRCGEEIGEECYKNEIEENIVGCDKCCKYAQEQNGCPLVEVQSGALVALDMNVKAVGYWELISDSIQEEIEIDLFYQESDWRG